MTARSHTRLRRKRKAKLNALIRATREKAEAEALRKQRLKR